MITSGIRIGIQHGGSRIPSSLRFILCSSFWNDPDISSTPPVMKSFFRRKENEKSSKYGFRKWGRCRTHSDDASFQCASADKVGLDSVAHTTIPADSSPVGPNLKDGYAPAGQFSGARTPLRLQPSKMEHRSPRPVKENEWRNPLKQYRRLGVSRDQYMCTMREQGAGTEGRAILPEHREPVAPPQQDAPPFPAYIIQSRQAKPTLKPQRGSITRAPLQVSIPPSSLSPHASPLSSKAKINPSQAHGVQPEYLKETKEEFSALEIHRDFPGKRTREFILCHKHPDPPPNKPLPETPPSSPLSLMHTLCPKERGFDRGDLKAREAPASIFRSFHYTSSSQSMPELPLSVISGLAQRSISSSTRSRSASQAHPLTVFPKPSLRISTAPSGSGSSTLLPSTSDCHSPTSTAGGYSLASNDSDRVTESPLRLSPSSTVTAAKPSLPKPVTANIRKPMKRPATAPTPSFPDPKRYPVPILAHRGQSREFFTDSLPAPLISPDVYRFASTHSSKVPQSPLHTNHPTSQLRPLLNVPGFSDVEAERSGDLTSSGTAKSRMQPVPQLAAPIPSSLRTTPYKSKHVCVPFHSDA
jgi:hypothetical protein